jgi:signal transduction histidine kinase
MKKSRLSDAQWSREELERTAHDLRERVKELNCLYSITNLVEQEGITLEQILQGTVDIIPIAWQYPEVTCSRMVLEDRYYLSTNFIETIWSQSQAILVGGTPAGFLQVCYVEEKPEMDEGPFLKEERSLLKVIAERIGGIIERKQAETDLKESEARNAALLSAIPDFMFQLNTDGFLMGFHEGKFSEHREFFMNLMGSNVYDLCDKKQLLPKRIVDQAMMYVKRAFSTGKTQLFEQHLSLGSTTADFEIRIAVSRPNEVLGIVRDVTFKKRLEREVLEISGREQRRIGQDLHDSLCQHLAGIGFMAKVLERKVAGNVPIDSTQPAEIVRLIDEAITLTRGFARGLNPILLESDGLMFALTELALNTERLFGVKCQFQCKRTILVEDESMAAHLYRIAQEAINNAIKHGKPKSISIVFTTDGKANMLSVSDDGVGIGNVAALGKGMGVSIMNYRASMIGATIDIRGGETGGTVVSCAFPTRHPT